MAKGPQYRVQFRRRREGKTNYYLRRRLLVSRLTRFVVRKSLNHLIVQLINPKVNGDLTIVSVNTKELQTKYGWKAGTGNLPAAYLVGYIAGKKALSKGIKQAIVDIGLYPCVSGSRTLAAIKGALQAGLKIPVEENILPDDDRVKGVHIKEYYEKIVGGELKTSKHQFTKLLAAGVDILKLPEHFNEVIEKINQSFQIEKTEKQSSKKTVKTTKGGHS